MSRAKTFRRANRIAREHGVSSEGVRVRVCVQRGPVIDWRAILALRVPCQCDRCKTVERWPKYYVGLRSGISYDCYEEAKAPTDERQYDGVEGSPTQSQGYFSTSKSPTAFALEHARKYGVRIERGIELVPESDAALIREIERVK